MRHTHPGLRRRALVTVALLTMTVCAQDPHATRTGKWIDQLLSSRSKQPRDFGKAPPQPLETLLDAAEACQDEPRKGRILRLIGDFYLQFRHLPSTRLDAAAERLLKIVKGQKRVKRGLGERIGQVRSSPDPGIAALISLGFMSSYLDQFHTEVQGLLQQEIEDHGGFHIKEVRQGYFRSLVRAQAPLGELVKKLDDDNPRLREYAAEVISLQGHRAREAVPALLEAFAAEHPSEIKVSIGNLSGSTGFAGTPVIRTAVARALLRIAPEDKRCRPAHVRIIREDRDPALLKIALRQVGTMGKAAESAIPQLCRLSESKDIHLARGAATALGMIGMAQPAVIEALQAAARRKEKIVALTAQAALRSLKPKENQDR